MAVLELVIKILKVLSLLFLASMLMLDISLYLTLSTFLDSFLEPKTWTGALERQNFSTMLQNVLVEASTLQIGGGGESTSALEQLNLSKETVKQTLKETFPKEWIDQKTNKTISDFLLYLQGKNEQFYGEIDISDIKPKLVNATIKLSEPSMDKIIEEQFNASGSDLVIPCTLTKDLAEYCKNTTSETCSMLVNELGLNSSLENSFENNSSIVCLNKTVSKDKMQGYFKSFFAEQIEKEFKNYPDSIKLIEPGGPEEEGLKTVRQIVGMVNMSNIVLFILPWIIIALIRLATSSIKSTLRWVGVPLLLIGMLTLLLGFGFPPLIEKIIEENLKNSMQVNGTLNNDQTMLLVTKIIILVKGIVFDVIGGFFSLLRLKASLISLIGLIMVIGSFVTEFPFRELKERNEPSRQ